MADFRERNIQNKGTPQHRFKFCEDCPLSECELAEEYTHFQKIHPEDQECELTRRSQNTIVVEAKVLSENEVPQVQKLPLWMSIAASELQLSYDPQQEGCFIRQYIYPLDCGSKWVADGIGDSYKVQVDADGKITKSDSYFGCLWSPITPVFISAQTGKGKNTFVEERLIPYVRELSIRTRQHYKVLILSNRLALKWQIELRLSGNSDSDDDDECICLYNKYADVMTYQGLLRNYQHLKQKKEEKEEEEPVMETVVVPVKKAPEVKKDTVVKDTIVKDTVVKDTATPVVKAEPVVISPVKEEMMVEEESPWYVIVGSFKNRQQAEHLKNKMIQLGFKDTQILHHGRELFRVSCGVFATHDEAWDKVFEIRRLYPKYKDVWAMKGI